MASLEPECSYDTSQELTELASVTGVNVWGTNQQTLEEQALQELDLFSKENSSNNVEDGEIVDSKDKEPSTSLDINSYIKRQEELKKRHEYQRTLLVSSKSRNAANSMSKLQQAPKKSKKRVKSPEIIKQTPTVRNDNKGASSGSEYVPSDEEIEQANKPARKKRKINTVEANLDKIKDDGCLQTFKARLEQYYKDLETEQDFEDEVEHYTIKGGLKVPMKIWQCLYSYQQDGVRWIWDIHQKSTGGLLGDEMGLGKTVQVIAFLASLQYSQLISKHNCFRGLGASIIVCPATVLHQWVKHFHDWAPEFRVAVLHQSGTYPGNKNTLIKEIHTEKGILITSYSGILKYKNTLQDFNWHYLILDEGHKIRNPNAKITIAAKQIRTPHKLMLTGSPMQNNLQELWSLFDFTNPSMLGDLTTFMEHFNNPIVQGGFTNATPMQEATASSVATTLKNIITPFLLRRSKLDVQEDINLPNKNEQVLFCSLTEEQRDLYKGYLMSDQVGYILGKDAKNWFSENQTRANVLIGITTLRKICNHPDIYLTEAHEDENVDEGFGFYKKSGKMIVVSALLKIWKKQKHRVLLFTQSRAMITIFEHFLSSQEYKYLKMDGSTAVASRQSLINKFNEDCSYDVFLLTTRVGGLGVNLTGADRVIIYDPDWNPATDTQARERAWRIGQEKQVTIYRLLSAGTIEEKMYQRQVWKQLLSNQVLLDPKTQRFFKSSNLHDLFTLPEIGKDCNPETANIFKDSRVKIQERINEKRAAKKSEIVFSDEKVQAMKSLAQQISKSLQKPPVKKTSYQIELNEERRVKLEEKTELKTLTAVELMYFNREKLKSKPKETPLNSVDDFDTKLSFSNALEYSERTSNLYNKLKSIDKIKNVEQEASSSSVKNSRRKESFKSVVDASGTIDGEKIDGLVRTEMKKIRKRHNGKGINSETQDEYVLEKLFAKKGVSGALQHDNIVESGSQTQTLRVQNEASQRASRALEALRKSRLDKWTW